MLPTIYSLGKSLIFFTIEAVFPKFLSSWEVLWLRALASFCSSIYVVNDSWQRYSPQHWQKDFFHKNCQLFVKEEYLRFGIRTAYSDHKKKIV